jgi:DNA-binding transcriptional regulator YbjK
MWIMTSSPQTAARRKPAHERRAEIVAAARDIALADGLASLTLRRVAEDLSVFPGLVSHYFPSVDDLLAEAFGAASSAELEDIFAIVGDDAAPTARMQRLLGALVSEDRDSISLLWLDAWHTSRRRPALRDEVDRQMLAWKKRVTNLIRAGVKAGEFRVEHPVPAAVRILALIDGLSVQAAIRSTVDYAIVRELVMGTTERELGLSPGALSCRTPSGRP